ncbi:MAG TPA: SDR family oxidoreductase [Beijerinckiaceae bacterium]|nr:SDR family oxidoreductase [Beijerinckiaceae bacterium]
MNLFVLGLGYSALYFIRRYRDRFARIAGTVTTPEKAKALGQEGIAAHVFAPDRADPQIADALTEAEGLLVSIPTNAAGDPVLERFGEEFAGAPRLRWVSYLSTVGVYGDHGGAWIDETTPPQPSSARARRRVAAEAAWLALGTRAGKAVQVFRLAGIYGPGRNELANLADGTAKRIVKPGQVFNRIHVDDIAAVLMASIERPCPGAIYNVADDEPAPQQDMVAYAAALAGVSPPPEIPFEQADLSPMAVSFWGANRRVRNRRIRNELEVRLRYPTFREGLQALRDAGEGP